MTNKPAIPLESVFSPRDNRRGLAGLLTGPIICALACTLLAAPACFAGNAAAAYPAVSHSAANDKKSATRWDPPNVDAPVNGLSSTPPCPLADVLQHAGERATELASNLQQFTAREKMHAEMLGQVSNTLASEDRDFDYLVFITREANGLLSVRESHKVTYGTGGFDQAMTDSGLAVLALIFYPVYAADYNMRCEGQTDYQGQKAWVIHFDQRKDKPAVTREFSTETRHYPAKLKGRAWIAADSYQVLHLETNLAEWIPGVRLKSEAISIDYGPVQFHIRPVTLWLPQSAEVFSEFTGEQLGAALSRAQGSDLRRYHAQYSFTDFQLFSVGLETQ
jgi:hypothetical protein